MSSIQYNNSKTLKLNNVLIKSLNGKEIDNLFIVVEKMESYIKVVKLFKSIIIDN